MASLATPQPPRPELRVPQSDQVIDTKDDVRHYLSELLPTWSTSTMTITRIQSGITNKIYKAHHPRGTPRAVLVRIFGGKHIFTDEDRARENAIFERLGEEHVAPPLIATFANGRVETWVYAHNIPLHHMTAPYVCVGVARAMARLHAFRPVGVPPVGQLWSVLEGWIASAVRLAEDARFPGIDVSRCVAYYHILKQRLIEGSSPIVFCHNDLLAGNIMVGDDSDDITIVDFEYSSYNYRGFDIGNFFCEAMGGTVDGHVDGDRYPSAAFRERFCRMYLQETGRSATDADVTGLVEEAEQFGLAAHLFWGFWALTQSDSSKVDFPYVLFAEQRFAQFFKRFKES